MAKFSYKKSMRKIISDTTDVTLTKDGTENLKKLVDFLYSRFINYCLERTEDGMTVLTARNAVESLFIGNIKRLALANGNRILTEYKNGMIKYEPDKPDIVKRKKKTKKEIAVEALEFADGVFDLTSIMFPETSIQDQAKRILCDLLQELALRISDFVQSKKSDIITLEDIRAALGQLLPPELSKHALAEGARLVLLFETGMLHETVRKQPPVKAKPKHVPKREVKAIPKLKTARKRKRSPSVGEPSPKRRRMPSRRKVSRKKIKTSRKRAKPKVSRRPVSRKRAPSRKVRPKVTPKKRVSRKPKPKKTARAKVSRKKRGPRRAPKTVSKKKPTKRAPSRKRRLPRKKTTAAKKAPTRVPPKKVRRISRKEPTKRKLDSKKITPPGIAHNTTKEISKGIREVNKSYRQKLPTESLKLTAEFLSSLLYHLIEEMCKLKSSVIGPEEVRAAVKKVFPPNLADLAIAHLSRVLMT